MFFRRIKAFEAENQKLKECIRAENDRLKARIDELEENIRLLRYDQWFSKPSSPFDLFLGRASKEISLRDAVVAIADKLNIELHVQEASSKVVCKPKAKSKSTR